MLSWHPVEQRGEQKCVSLSVQLYKEHKQTEQKFTYSYLVPELLCLLAELLQLTHPGFVRAVTCSHITPCFSRVGLM